MIVFICFTVDRVYPKLKKVVIILPKLWRLSSERTNVPLISERTKQVYISLKICITYSFSGC